MDLVRLLLELARLVVA
jgi:hypothetical protein